MLYIVFDDFVFVRPFINYTSGIHSAFKRGLCIFGKVLKFGKGIKEDKNKAGVRLEMRRSALIDNIVGIIREGALTMGDLDGFSEELKDTVRFFLGNGNVNENVYDN